MADIFALVGGSQKTQQKPPTETPQRNLTVTNKSSTPVSFIRTGPKFTPFNGYFETVFYDMELGYEIIFETFHIKLNFDDPILTIIVNAQVGSGAYMTIQTKNCFNIVDFRTLTNPPPLVPRSAPDPPFLAPRLFPNFPDRPPPPLKPYTNGYPLIISCKLDQTDTVAISFFDFPQRGSAQPPPLNSPPPNEQPRCKIFCGSNRTDKSNDYYMQSGACEQWNCPN